VDLPTVVGIVASVAFLVRLLPQPLRLARTGVPDGVSPMAAINIAVSELAWLVYGLVEGLVPVWAVSLVSLPLALWTVGLLRRQVGRRDLAGGAAWLAVMAATWALGILGLALALSVVVNYGPQVVTALRSDRLEGLAPATWWLALLDAATWGAYGLVVADPELILYTVVLSTSAGIILVRIRQTAAPIPGDAVPFALGAEAA